MAQSTLRGTPSVPLTPSNVIPVVRKVKIWWWSLTDYLFIPDSKQREIRARFPDEEDQKKEAISYWINTDPLAGWRRLIIALECVYETELADSIRSNAEPITDDSLSLHSLTTAVSSVEDIWILLGNLGFPESVKNKGMLSGSYSSEEEKREAGLQYYLQTVPDASWRRIAGGLWYMEEYTALETVKQYLPPTHDLSFTHSNLTLALDTLPAYQRRLFGDWMGVPESTQNKIESQFSSDEERKTEVLRVIATEHPYPTWQQVSDALYRTENHTVLDRMLSIFPTGRYRNKQLYDQEMRHGHIIVDLDKLLVSGIAGSGKSTLLESLLGQNPSDTRCSTPLLNEPINIKIIDKKNKKEWKVQSLSELKSKIAEILRSRIPQLQTPEESSGSQVSTYQKPSSTTVVESDQSTPDRSIRSTAKERTASSEEDKLTIGTQEMKERSQDYVQQTSEVDDELVSLMSSVPSTSAGPILRQRLFLALDSGGQPELLEMMPVFLKRASKYAYVFKLNESLDDRGMIAYYRNGKLVSQYLSSHTNEAILRLFLRTIVSFNKKNPNISTARIMLVGTHRDLVPKEKLPEVLDTLHKKLKGILLPQFRDQLIFSDPATEEFVFPLNAKEPDDDDLECADRIREGLGEVGEGGKELDVPLRWYVLYYKLVEASSQLGKKVLPQDLCQKVAETLGMDEELCGAALEFFHDLNMLFYFVDILPQIVFIEPQMLLNKVSELADETYELMKGGKGRPVVGEMLKFRDYAQVTEKFLSQYETHYEQPLFTAKELVILLKHLLVFAEMSEGVYFVPCLLRVVGWEEVEKHRVNGEKALVIHFPDSGPLLGMFCSTVAYLMSPENQYPCPWRAVSDDRGAPDCLHRNVIEFEVSDYAGSVSLIDHFTHFEIHLNTSPDQERELWKVAQEAVFAGLKKTNKTIGYTNNTPVVAIVCPAHHTTPTRPHPAIVRGKTWKCSKTPKEFGEINSTSIPWLEMCTTTVSEVSGDVLSVIQSCSTSDATTSPHMSLPNIPGHLRKRSLRNFEVKSPSTKRLFDDIDDHFEVLDEVYDVACRWKSLGAALRLSPPVLDIIQEKHRDDPTKCLGDVLTEWLKQSYNTERHGLPTWKMLVDAVAHRSGGNDCALANRIATKYHVSPPPAPQ